MKSKNKFLLRLLVVYIIQLMIKGFDLTFGQFKNITFRGQVIGWFFIIMWITAWYLSEILNKSLKNMKLAYKLVIHLIFGYSVALLTNIGYKFVDILFFNNAIIWQNNSDFNPELTISISLIYMLIYAMGEYIQSKLQVKEEQIKSEKLTKENVLVQYQSLKNQIEPHFLFNSLSVLSSIIHTDINLASEFLVKLSKTLRYIIEKNKFTLVELREELNVVTDYFFLLKTRFGNAVHLKIDMDNNGIDEIYIPPATIQLLIENAVKHNKLSEAFPLTINIDLSENYIRIVNNLNKRLQQPESTQMGLKNIKERYKLIANKDVLIKETSKSFSIKLPKLNKKHYENFNN